MTVSSDTNRSGPYNGNGVTTAFDYDFKIEDRTHLKVIRRDASGVETVLTLDADYTVTGVGDNDGGQVITAVAPPVGVTITILLNVPFTQEIDLENQGAYYAETVERGFDLAVMRDQQLQEQVDRSVKIPPSEDPVQLDGLVEGILRIASSADNIDTVGQNIGPVTTVSNNIGSVNTVAGISSNVTTVAGIATAIGVVAGIATAVSTVAGIAGAVFTVAGIAAAVLAVAAIATAVEKVAAIDSEVVTVAYNIADVTNFADVYQGPKATAPTTRNDGSPLRAGDLYFNTTSGQMFVYSPPNWTPAAQVIEGAGDVLGPNGEVLDGEVALFDGTTGKRIKGSHDGTALFRGNAAIRKEDPAILLDKAGPGQTAQFRGLYDTKVRWIMDFANGEAETGDNEGSNFSISAFDDEGNLLHDVVWISRRWGTVYFNGHEAYHEGFKATAANYRMGTANKILTAGEVWSAAAYVGVSGAAGSTLAAGTYTPNFNAGINFYNFLGGNITLGNPTNAKPGQSGIIVLRQDATGGRTVAFGSDWKFANGAVPPMNTAPSRSNVIAYTVLAPGYVIASVLAGLP